MQSVSAAVWLGESYRALGDDGMSRKWWEEACQRTKELMEFDPATACYWQGRVLEGLGVGGCGSCAQGLSKCFESAVALPCSWGGRGGFETVAN